MEKFLSDIESKNDYQLVNELAWLVRKYEKKNKPIDKKFIEAVLKIVEVNYNSGDIKLIMKNIESGASACISNDFYNVEKDHLYFNDTMLIKSHFYTHVYYVILLIIHEFTHKICFDLINNCGKSNDLISYYAYLFNFVLIEDSIHAKKLKQIYNENHDLFLIERIANIRGDYIALQVFNKLYANSKNKKILCDTVYDYLIENLLKGYDEYGNYPQKNFFKIIDREIEINPKLIKNLRIKFQIPNLKIRDDNLLERLYLGLKITKDEYEYLKELSSNKEINKDIKKRLRVI